jgi:hypothetical protein
MRRRKICGFVNGRINNVPGDARRFALCRTHSIGLRSQKVVATSMIEQQTHDVPYLAPRSRRQS